MMTFGIERGLCWIIVFAADVMARGKLPAFIAEGMVLSMGGMKKALLRTKIVRSAKDVVVKGYAVNAMVQVPGVKSGKIP